MAVLSFLTVFWKISMLLSVEVGQGVWLEKKWVGESSVGVAGSLSHPLRVQSWGYTSGKWITLLTHIISTGMSYFTIFGATLLILQPALVRQYYTNSQFCLSLSHLLSLSGRICRYVGGVGGCVVCCWMLHSSCSSSSSQRPPSSSAPWTSLTSPSLFTIWTYVTEHSTYNGVCTWSAVVLRLCVVFVECRYQPVLPHSSTVDLLCPAAHYSVLLYTGGIPLDQVDINTKTHNLHSNKFA